MTMLLIWSLDIWWCKALKPHQVFLVYRFPQFRCWSTRILLSCWGIVWKEICGYLAMNLQLWALCMTYYMVGWVDFTQLLVAIHEVKWLVFYESAISHCSGFSSSRLFCVLSDKPFFIVNTFWACICICWPYFFFWR